MEGAPPEVRRQLASNQMALEAVASMRTQTQVARRPCERCQLVPTHKARASSRIIEEKVVYSPSVDASCTCVGTGNGDG